MIVVVVGKMGGGKMMICLLIMPVRLKSVQNIFRGERATTKGVGGVGEQGLPGTDRSNELPSLHHTSNMSHGLMGTS